MDFERKKNALRNIATGFFNKFISILFPFVLRTVIIKKLGMNYLGLDNLFTSILQVLNLSELGFSSAVAYCMYKPLANGIDEEVNALYCFVKKAYNIVGIIVFIFGIALTPFLKFFISGSIPSNVNIYILYYIYILNAGGSYFLFAYKNVLLYATQRIDINNKVYTFTRIIMYIFQLFLLLMYNNYYMYIIMLPLSTVLNNLLISHIVDKKFPQYTPEGKLSNDKVREIKYQISGLFIGKLSQVTRNAFDSIIISSLLGLSITAIYNNYYYVVTSLVSIMVVISSSIIPSIGNSIASDSVEKNYTNFLDLHFLYMWISGCITVCLFFLYQPFMIMWVGKKYMLPDTSVFLFSIYFYCLVIGNIRAVYIEATGLWWQNKERAIAEVMCNLILNVILGIYFGINGILVATIISIVVINFIFSAKVLYKYYFKDFKITTYFINTIYYALTTMIAFLVCSFFTRLFVENTVLNLFFKGISCFFIVNLIFILFFQFTSNYKNIKKMVISKFKEERQI